MAFPILGNPKETFLDSAGAHLDSGTLAVLEPTDDTNKASYPTADDADAATNANVNPVVLDSRGEAPTGLFGRDDEKYKLVLKDSGGTTIWTVDDVRCPLRLDSTAYDQGGTNADKRSVESRLRERSYTKDWGAVVDGSTDDKAKVTDAFTDEDGITLSKGNSVIASSVAVGNDEGLYGEVITSKITADDAIGSGIPLIAIAAARAKVDGVHIDLPGTASNAGRGIRLREVTDSMIVGSRFKSEKVGAWPILFDQNVDRIGVIACEFDTISNAIIWKPNLIAPTVETYNGTMFLAALNNIRGASSGGRIGVSIDGDCTGGAVIGNLIYNLAGESGSQAFAVGLANDGGNLDKLSGVMCIGNIGHTLNDEIFHQEDECNGVFWIGNAGIGGTDGVYVINTVGQQSGFPRNVGIIANFCRDLSETGVYVAGTGESHNFNIIGNIVENFGTGGAQRGILVGQANSSHHNILANIIDGGTGDGIEAQGTSKTNISYNIVSSASDDGLVLATSPTHSVYIESNNILSDATGGPIDESKVDGASGDKDVYRYNVDSATSADHMLGHFRRPAVITRVEIIYEDAADGTASPALNVGFSGGAEVISAATLKDASPAGAQWSVDNLNTFVSRLVPAGSVLTASLTTGTSNTYKFTIKVNYFEYS